MRCSFFVALAACLTLVTNLQAQQQVQVTVENLQPSNGFYFTPVWFGFHDGSFDLFDAGTQASSALESLAENGDASGIVSDFAGTAGTGVDGLLFGTAGFNPPPLVDPGESISSGVLNLGASDRYLSFASMLLPTNDGFFANDNPTGIEVLDASGDFSFGGPITLSFAQLWDSGSELNDGLGAPFSALGGTSTDTNENITLHTGLAAFNGTATGAGTTVDTANLSDPIFRITVTAVPEPSSLALIVLGVGGVATRRRRNLVN